MTERPLIQPAPMVRAMLANRKRQTRVVLDPQLASTMRGRPWASMEDLLRACPLGVVGDRLYVKETWSKSALSVYPCPAAWYRADFWQYDDPASAEHVRGCNRNQGDCFACAADREGHFRWRSAGCMPRAIARLRYEIEAVRVQRLNSITEEDAQAEGAEPVPHELGTVWRFESYAPRISFTSTSAKQSFAGIWTYLNDGRGWPWVRNPWVYAVTFRRVYS